jgi:hypothetical protein
MTPICSSVWVVAMCVIQLPIALRSARYEATIFCFVNTLTIIIMSSLLNSVRLVTDDFDTEWDDSCPGLVETIA